MRTISFTGCALLGPEVFTVRSSLGAWQFKMSPPYRVVEGGAGFEIWSESGNYVEIKTVIARYKIANYSKIIANFRSYTPQIDSTWKIRRDSHEAFSAR